MGLKALYFTEEIAVAGGGAMMNYRLARLVMVGSLLLLLMPPARGLSVQPSPIESQTQWLSFIPPDEDFTAAIPARPTTRSYPIDNNPFDTREKVLAHHEYSGYGDGLIFIIHSYKANHPAKLSISQLNLVNETDVFQRIQLGDVVADEFRTIVPSRYANYTKHVLRFMTDKRLYVIGLMTLAENNPAVDRFITGIRMRKPGDQVTPIEQLPESSGGNVLSGKDVTRKVIVVWKSVPSYTPAARAHQVLGTVVLQAAFGADGYVTNIRVFSGLKDGLDENAIEAARNLRFFPAEKDGKPVGQWMMLEYHFNLY